MKIEAYKYSHCGTLHETEKAFKSCEKTCLAKKDEAVKAAELRKNESAMLDYPRMNATSFEHLIQICRKKAKELWNVELDFTLDISYSPTVSNSNSAPIGKKANWDGHDKSLPTAYKGFYGRISGTSKHLKKVKLDLSGSDFFAGSFGQGFRGINLGSGGGGSEFSYDVSLFLDDFPLIAEKFRADKEKVVGLRDESAAQQALTEEIICNDTECNQIKVQEFVIEQQIKELQEKLYKLQTNRQIHEAEITVIQRDKINATAKQISEINSVWKVRNN